MILTATTLWGFGFIAVKWSLAAFSPVSMTAWRYLVASFFSLIVMVCIPYFRRSFPRKNLSETLLYAAIAGILLAGLMLTQTIGLVYTSATNSAFITTLYAVFVPLICFLLFKIRLSPSYWFALFIAILGTALLCRIGFEQLIHFDFNKGDLLTVVAAFLAAVHIMVLDKAAKSDLSIAWFNLFQYVVTAIVVWPFALLMEPEFSIRAVDPNSKLAWIGFAFAAIPSTVVSFSLQTLAQKYLPAYKASLLLLMESPFAMLFAWICLGEMLTAGQFVGAGAIVFAAGFVMLHQAFSKVAL